jgi:hypothetical protein
MTVVVALFLCATTPRNRYDMVAIMGKDATIAARCAKCNECSNLWVVMMLQCGVYRFDICSKNRESWQLGPFAFVAFVW